MTSSGFCVWFTGLPASGKSTLANLLALEARRRGKTVQVLDSDELRKILTPEPTYSAEEREWFYSTLAYIGGLLVDNGVNVLIAATAHRRAYRLQARDHLPEYIEIYLDCPLEVCRVRDQKGTYEKALSAEATTVPGVQELYETPESPAIVVDTGSDYPEECLAEIVSRLEQFGHLPPMAENREL